MQAYFFYLTVLEIVGGGTQKVHIEICETDSVIFVMKAHEK